jgi:glycosyltransferase involved in cell wall biosynthesis
MSGTDVSTAIPGEVKSSPLFTVFTPTYDRAHTLHRAYDSLTAQTLRDFEWLIVDDGSRDGTRALVETWARQAPFPIRYLYQEHGGLNVAFNRAVHAARGEFFVTIDSDDGCVPQALERLNWNWEQIPPEERERFTGVTALCVDQHGQLHGTRFPRDVLDSDSVEIRYRYALKGGKWGFHRTGVLKRHLQEEPGQVYIVADVVWSSIAQEYKTRFVNEVLHVYWVCPTQGSSITHTPVSRTSAAANKTWNRIALNRDLKWFRHAPLRFLRHAANYSRFSLWVGTGFRPQWRELRPLARCLWILTLPVAVGAFARDKLQERQRARAGAGSGTAPAGGQRSAPSAVMTTRARDNGPRVAEEP